MGASSSWAGALFATRPAHGAEIEKVSATELVLPPDASMALVAERLVGQAKHDGVSLTGEGGLLTGLVQRVLQSALETEMTDHLGYERHSSDGWGSGNSRNGSYPKSVAPVGESG